MSKIIVWLRHDLRVEDNPALIEASLRGEVIPVYILDPDESYKWSMGAASKWWLHHSLLALINSGVPLVLRLGSPLSVLQDLLAETNAEALYFNRGYEPQLLAQEKEIEAHCPCVKSFCGNLLYEPWEVLNKAGSFFKVYTPFWKACLASPPSRKPYSKAQINYAKQLPRNLDLTELKLLPQNPNWSAKFSQYWSPGEKGAQKALTAFIETKLSSYARGRDIPSLESTSRLSPHLHFGEISPSQIWKTIHNTCDPSDVNVQRFLAELGWREFSYYLLYHFPRLPEAPFQSKFKQLPWQQDDVLMKAWQQGKTGYALIDAGMRELWETGYMHNRVRMIVASFLTKHCLIPWQDGEAWFWDTLVDADLANNAASWQWVAGCGADAAPYFRIFNPITQSKKFDPEGDYIRRWVPELRQFDDKNIHEPWKTPTELQRSYKCIIGQDYPKPIIELNRGRERALEAYQALR